MGPDRGDQDASGLQPLQQFFGDIFHRRSHDDAVEAAEIFRDVVAIAEDHLDIVVAEFGQPLAGIVGQRPVTLDADDLPSEL